MGGPLCFGFFVGLVGGPAVVLGLTLWAAQGAAGRFRGDQCAADAANLDGIGPADGLRGSLHGDRAEGLNAAGDIVAVVQPCPGGVARVGAGRAAALAVKVFDKVAVDTACRLRFSISYQRVFPKFFPQNLVMLFRAWRGFRVLQPYAHLLNGCYQVQFPEIKQQTVIFALCQVDITPRPIGLSVGCWLPYTT